MDYTTINLINGVVRRNGLEAVRAFPKDTARAYLEHKVNAITSRPSVSADLKIKDLEHCRQYLNLLASLLPVFRPYKAPSYLRKG